ncbi:MAG: T9SS type A sorting domain-containing protein [Chitinophagaceae bacterium]|nr:T9SS type A sorting domain-containing protein [Chitinophagaceae bacterium]MBK9959135.1 T9SS type A sorting domain-containing protein [Chitinophagaceae bacterium]
MSKHLLKGVCTFISMIIISLNVFSQSFTPIYSSMTGFSNGYYEYLPQGYWNNAEEKFPLIIFVHGIGECGNGTSDLGKVLVHGTPKQINNGSFPTSFNVNGQNFKFIVLAPQFTGWAAYIQMNDVINYAVSHYKVDLNRIYLTGLSMGGGCIWEYAGYSQEYASRVAAIVPVCGASSATTDKINHIANSDLAVWATHNLGDGTVGVAATNTYIDGINAAPNPPTPLAKKTIFPVNGHDAWSQTYNLSFKENGYNVYEWMLTNKRNVEALPVTGFTFSAIKASQNTSLLKWSTLSETANLGFAVEKSINGVNYTQVAFINSSSINGSGAVYQFIDQQPQRGKNYYRIKQVDIDNRFSYSSVKILNFDIKPVIQIGPNPATDFITIKTELGNAKTSVKLFNQQGQLLQTAAATSQQLFKLPASNLPNGVYYLQVNNDGNIETQKILIQH